MNIDKTILEIKSQAAVQDVEHAFIANLHGSDVLFVKATGNAPAAFRLPSGFVEKLEAAREPKRLFALGKTFLTPGAIEALNNSSQSAETFLEKHQTGDWGAVSEVDWNENDFSVSAGYRILSAYLTAKGEKIWVITEADRSATTLLLPSEY